ncbi:Hypothetical protein SCLAV_1353 [Streptomyces clavuligerus]|uniref:Uncharacterized protein n=2 Tax=Streptomyces clavuligerus TaxID=1901 RepID=E2Q0N9_STRCL|nr:Hypothetical protein SCLAV_1353 [Streptomyces clavuligerus]
MDRSWRSGGEGYRAPRRALRTPEAIELQGVHPQFDGAPRTPHPARRPCARREPAYGGGAEERRTHQRTHQTHQAYRRTAWSDRRIGRVGHTGRTRAHPTRGAPVAPRTGRTGMHRGAPGRARPYGRHGPQTPYRPGGGLGEGKRTALMTTVPTPTTETRWRCTLCGNLTRFDVTRSSRVVEYVHLDLAGEPRVEERQVLSETIESVRCRWCNAQDKIELVDRPDTDS